MSMIKKTLGVVFAGFTGSPASDTDWEKLDWPFDAQSLKVVVKTADLEYSMDGKELFGKLPAGTDPMVYDFPGIGISRFFVRKTAAVVEVMAFAVK